MLNTTVNTTDFSIFNQIFFWKRNRIYQLIIKDEKLYGIYLERRLDGVSKTVIIVDIITFVLGFLVSFLPLVFPNLIPDRGFLYYSILFSFFIISFEIFIRIPYFANKINQEQSN